MRNVNINNIENKIDVKRNIYFSKENNSIITYINKNQFNSQKYSDNNTEHNAIQDLIKLLIQNQKIIIIYLIEKLQKKFWNKLI